MAGDIVKQLRDTRYPGQMEMRVAAAEEIELLRTVLTDLVNARALAGVRGVVAGWNGERRPDGPFEHRHPAELGATLPKTNCGAVYALDEAMQRARSALAVTSGIRE